nr:multifunctional CCA addition/repair protein [Sessilibacter corallicola]
MTHENLSSINAYLVGGAVRDELLQRPVADRDWVVVGSTPEQLIDLGFTQIGNDFPCFLHPDSKEEYALARTEQKSGEGHTGFICDFHPNISLEDDLLRRDLTINAIAKRDNGDYVDPYGGIDDLNNRVLRHVSPAFVEDPLRVLRVARFAARFANLGFSVHSDTMALMSVLAQNDELDLLTPERVWKEISRALTEPKPSEFFRVLRACGALKSIMPELDCLFGVPQPEQHHPEIDTGEHVMLCLDYARQQFNDLTVTWAVLLHDLGKGVTPKEQWPSHVDHENLGEPLVREVNKRLKTPKELGEISALVAKHHLRAHQLKVMKAGTIMKLIESLDGIRRPERVGLFINACEADARGRLGLEESPYPQRIVLENALIAAKSVEVKPLLEKGYKGKDLAEQIRQARIKAIKHSLQ